MKKEVTAVAGSTWASLASGCENVEKQEVRVDDEGFRGG